MNPVKSSARTAALLAAVLSLAGCGSGADAHPTPPPRDAAILALRDSAPAVPEARPAPEASPEPAAVFDHAPAQIRGIYVNAYAAGSSRRLGELLAIADDTEINTFVVDVKTERGVHFDTGVPLAKQLQQPGERTERNLKALADTLHAHHLYAVARMVVFKDPVLSKAKPDWSIRQPGGGLWVDKAGNTWVSAWDRNVWDYNLDVAEEVARAGFDEIQFDYVRFPEPYRSLPPQVHPQAQGDRTDAIAAFLNEAKRRLHPLGVSVGADVFGLSPNDPGDVGIGQQWETIASTADHIYPMMYPSHYLPTHLPGVRKPDLMPYETLYKSAGMARLRAERMQEVGVRPARVVVWIQGFTATWLRDHLTYGPEEIRKQKQGVYDVGFEDWVIWHPGSKYESLVAGLDRGTATHAKAAYQPPADVLATVDLFEKQGVKRARQRAARQARGETSDETAAREAKTGTKAP
ncbi:MAG TPA: putative glycoside hydrolase [Longimicrobiaceae bacterium]|nr:putative glycoside hydrolase [Longimicrobiaceae bacterium]